MIGGDPTRDKSKKLPPDADEVESGSGTCVFSSSSWQYAM